MNNISLNTDDLMGIIQEYESDKTEAHPCNLRAFCIYIMHQYQPERSKREDFDYNKLADEYTNHENHGNYGVYDFAKWLNQRCGALNTMET